MSTCGFSAELNGTRMCCTLDVHDGKHRLIVEKRSAAPGFPSSWAEPIAAFTAYMRLRDLSPETIALRQNHLRRVARTRHLVDVDRFLELDRSGMTAAEIAVRLGCSERTVQRIRVSTGRTRGHVPPYPLSTRDVAWRVLDDGGSISEAARTAGVCRRTVRNWFPDHPAWTREEAGHASVLARRLGAL